MKRCVNCNQLEENDSRFCSRCGGQVLEELISPGGERSKEKSRQRREKVIAVTLCSFMSVIAIFASLAFLLHASISEKTIEATMSEVFEEDELADFEIGELVDAKEEDMTLAEYAYSMLDEQAQTWITPKDMEELLNEGFVLDFVTEKMKDYLSDALYGNNKGKIKTAEIMELLEDNDKKIEKLTGVSMSKNNLRVIEEYIEDNKILKEAKLSVYTKKYESEFSTLRFLFSDKLRILLVVLGILLLAAVFLVLSDRMKACCYVGIAFIVVGCMNVLLVVMSFALPGIVDNVLPLGEEVYKEMFASMRLHSVIQTAVALVVGAACVLLATCSKRRSVY